MPTQTIDLGNEGLSDGDDIDPYLEEHFDDGNEVLIPPGDYDSEFTWWGTTVSDAAVRGDPAGVRLHRPPGLTYEEDDGSDLKIYERLQFDDTVVIENITLKNQHGWQQNRLDNEGLSADAHLEIRNFNCPDGTVGHSDTLFGRSYGTGQVTYKWCYLENWPNSAFYQLESGSDVKQVIEGCVFRNATNIHRAGCREYTVRDCIYIADGDAPQFCEEETAPCDGDPWGGSQRPFKFDGSFGWSNGRFENLHFHATDEASVIFFMDFQDDQQDISGSMDGIHVYNETDRPMFRFEWDVPSNWDIGDVHMTGPGNLETPDGVDPVASPERPTTDYEVWTPNGEGIGTVDSTDGGDVEVPTELARLDVDSVSAADFDYRMVVSGYIEQHPDDEESNDEVNVLGTDPDRMEARGRTGSNSSDVWEFNGTVESWEIVSGDVNAGDDYVFLVDGEEVGDVVGVTAPGGGGEEAYITEDEAIALVDGRLGTIFSQDVMDLATPE